MPRKPKPTIGTCPCPQCGKDSPVRKEASGRLYGTCPDCSSFKGQDWILEKGQLFGATAAVPAAPAAKPAPVPAPGSGVKPIKLAPARQPPAGEAGRQVDIEDAIADREKPTKKAEQGSGIWPWNFS